MKKTISILIIIAALTFSISTLSKNSKNKTSVQINKKVFYRTITINPSFLSKKINYGLIRYRPDMTRRTATYRYYRFNAHSFNKILGHPLYIKKPITVRIKVTRTKTVKSPGYAKGSRPYGGFTYIYYDAIVLKKFIKKPHDNKKIIKKDSSVTRKINRYMTIRIKATEVKRKKGWYVYSVGSSQPRKRGRFINYYFRSYNYKSKIRYISSYATVKVRLYRLTVNTWYPKHPRASYPIGGFKTYKYYGKIIRVIRKR